MCRQLQIGSHHKSPNCSLPTLGLHFTPQQKSLLVSLGASCLGQASTVEKQEEQDPHTTAGGWWKAAVQGHSQMQCPCALSSWRC